MKIFRIVKVLIPIVFVFLALLACEDSDETKNYIDFNGIEFPINESSYINLSSQQDSIGVFKVQFSDQAENPLNTFVFRLFSENKTEIKEGSYAYDFWPSSPYSFSFTEINTSQGDALDEYNSSWSGHIYISKDSEEYHFEFDVLTTPTGGENASSIKGEFKGVLTEKQ